ncbi:amidase [Vibrio sp.]|nr:amidase [Vibrio sp.]
MNNDAVFCAQGPKELLPTGLGTLTGLNFVFKDLFDVQGYVTGAGNPQWLKTHDKAQKTSPLIEQLLNQGAECIGRVQTDELAYSLNGQNIHYGTPVNPKAPDCIPGGSSSGSAVTVAKGDADFAIGTDTGGSVRVPASYCGIFGLRPTLGKISLDAAFELSKSFDTAGLFARRLPVLKRVYQAITSENANTSASKVGILSAFCSKQHLQRLNRFSLSAQEHGIDVTMVDDVSLTEWMPKLSELFRTIQGYEIIAQHDAWLSQHLDSLDPAIAERVEWARTITPQQYEASQTKQAVFRDQFIQLLKSAGGIVVLPTTPAGPPKLITPPAELAVYRSELMGMTAIAGLAGCPQLHIPMLNFGLGPCGISLLGVPGSELNLINTALTLVGDGEGL